MKKISRRRTASRAPGRRWTRLKVQVGEPDESLTENGGLLLVAELDRALGITAALDVGIGPVKERDRGLSGGEFALATAVVQLAGEDHLVGFDNLRADAIGEGLLPAPIPPSTTAATLSARFDQAQREGIERACARLTGRALAALPVAERAKVLSGPVTIDLDAKDIEVFSTRKEQVIRSYKGEIAGRVADGERRPAAGGRAGPGAGCDRRAGRGDRAGQGARSGPVRGRVRAGVRGGAAGR